MISVPRRQRCLRPAMAAGRVRRPGIAWSWVQRLPGRFTWRQESVPCVRSSGVISRRGCVVPEGRGEPQPSPCKTPPPEGRTPYECRFMESFDVLLNARWDDEPDGFPQRFETDKDCFCIALNLWEGSWRAFMRFCARIGTTNPPQVPLRRGAAPVGQFPSWEGSGVGWFSQGSRKDRLEIEDWKLEIVDLPGRAIFNLQSSINNLQSIETSLELGFGAWCFSQRRHCGSGRGR